MQNIYEKVSQMDESSLTAWIVQMSETISEKLKCARNSSARRLIVEAQNIVKERYMEADISLRYVRFSVYRILIFILYLKKKRENRLSLI